MLALPVTAQTGSTSQNPTAVFSTPGSKQVTLKACNPLGCNTVTRTVVVLDPKPHVLALGSVPSTVGAGQIVPLSAQTTGRPALNHLWTITGTAGTVTLNGNPASWNTQTPGIGSYQIQLQVKNTDGTAASVPVQINVVASTFADVPPSFWAWKYIEAIHTAGLTVGCDPTPNFCPNNQTMRAELAPFFVRALHGRSFVPPPATGIFTDVPTTHWAAPWIEQLWADGLTTGCTTAPLRYCPDVLVTRAEMAPFLLRAMHGASYTPPPLLSPTTSFVDVDTGFWAAPWIEQLFAEGLTTGCVSSPRQYCPSALVTRAEVAGFLARAFHLPVP